MLQVHSRAPLKAHRPTHYIVYTELRSHSLQVEYYTSLIRHLRTLPRRGGDAINWYRFARQDGYASLVVIDRRVGQFRFLGLAGQGCNRSCFCWRPNVTFRRGTILRPKSGPMIEMSLVL